MNDERTDVARVATLEAQLARMTATATAYRLLSKKRTKQRRESQRALTAPKRGATDGACSRLLAVWQCKRMTSSIPRAWPLLRCLLR